MITINNTVKIYSYGLYDSQDNLLGYIENDSGLKDVLSQIKNLGIGGFYIQMEKHKIYISKDGVIESPIPALSKEIKAFEDVIKRCGYAFNKYTQSYHKLTQ